MSLAAVVVNDGNARRVLAGDAIATNDVGQVFGASANPMPTSSVLSNLAYTAGGGTAYLPDVGTLVTALAAVYGANLGADTAWRVRVVNQNSTTAQTVTTNSNNGWSTAADAVALASATVPAYGSRDLLIRLKNTLPTKVIAYTSTSGSAVYTAVNPADLAGLQVGMVVTTAGSGMATGQTVIAVSQAAGTFTLSANSSATNTSPVSSTIMPSAQVGWI